MTETETAARLDTPFTAEHFVAYCLRMVGRPYWFATCGYKATESLLKKKQKQYPKYYGSSRTAKFKRDIANKEVVCDCIGGLKAYAWTNGGECLLAAVGTDEPIKSNYQSNGCPDKGASSMFSYAKSKGCAWGTLSASGDITTIMNMLPEVPGIALYKSGHVGYYIGGGYAVEWKGTNYGCVKTKLQGRGWTNWYQIPFIDYGDADLTIHLGMRTLKRGSKGDDVKELQEKLLTLGYDIGKTGVDGIYGKMTESAVKQFQKEYGLTVDGKYGPKSHAKMTGTKA